MHHLKNIYIVQELASYLKYLSVFIASGSLKVLTWEPWELFHFSTSKCWNFHDFSSECILSKTSFSSANSDEEFDSVSESSITISSLRNVTAKKQIICDEKVRLELIFSNQNVNLPESKELKGIYISLAFRSFGTFSNKACWKSCQHYKISSVMFTTWLHSPTVVGELRLMT